MNNVLEYLKQIIPKLKGMSSDDIEHYVIEEILSSPYNRASLVQIYNVVDANYYPGLFLLNERKNAPDFLLEEMKVPFDEWLFSKFDAEINQLYKNKTLYNKIEKIGAKNLIRYSIDILYLKNKRGRYMIDLISNQEYSDIFRRILMLLIVGNPFYIYNNHWKFNQLGKDVVPQVIKMTKQYNLRERLFQSIASGLLGMDIKESIVSTAPISLESNLNIRENTINQITEKLEFYIKNHSKIGIDCFEQYYDEVVNGNNLHIVWFTDDYIETIFELKFIEEQMWANRTLSFTIVPRYDSYSNDASYKDILEFLDLDELQKLKGYYVMGRLNICKNGMDISTVDFFRMSSELYDIMEKADICVISGARAFEMTQGLKKIVYYTGIAVCKSYTESITGFSRKSGKLIFLRQNPGDYSFQGFRDRAWRKILDDDNLISVAKITAKEYYEEKSENNVEFWDDFK